MHIFHLARISGSRISGNTVVRTMFVWNWFCHCICICESDIWYPSTSNFSPFIITMKMIGYDEMSGHTFLHWERYPYNSNILAGQFRTTISKGPSLQVIGRVSFSQKLILYRPMDVKCRSNGLIKEVPWQMHCQSSNITRTKAQHLNCFLSRYAVVFAQSTEARC